MINIYPLFYFCFQYNLQNKIFIFALMKSLLAKKGFSFIYILSVQINLIYIWILITLSMIFSGYAYFNRHLQFWDSVNKCLLACALKSLKKTYLLAGFEPRSLFQRETTIKPSMLLDCSATEYFNIQAKFNYPV